MYVVLRGAADLYPYDEDTQHSVIRAIGVSHTACKDEFRSQIFELDGGGVYFCFYKK